MSEFATSVERLLTLVRHWEESRWAAGAGDGTRGDLAHALVQRLADLGAEAEGRAPRPVPRAHDLVLPDQLRVVADDLITAEPADDLLARATTAVDEVRRTL
ncbi:hypothetical protein GCM10010168_12670 [Actinoplanes ianthinogenes]|uniref:Uncharacterized protein n=1 Tax=Actinoplanes ianthinogenes TaxID=122358 RepID=A0ABN6CIR1_9ACTN|nr:hypothetical protein [Actinoplanes ianthinogenes]BCJ44453.1 hypothetical protein Aiant_51100 [Actinoplanes ianthinogenes]GGQ98070.1 hypothetical protein GCM10010168_12670 [Actinoplanes ianthinogenes]